MGPDTTVRLVQTGLEGELEQGSDPCWLPAVTAAFELNCFTGQKQHLLKFLPFFFFQNKDEHLDLEVALDQASQANGSDE